MIQPDKRSDEELERTPTPREEAPWMRYAGFVESGDMRSSQSIDDVVYRS